MKISVATPDDAASFLAIYAPIVSDTAISFEIEPPTLEEMGTRVRMILTRFPWLRCDVDGRVAGYAYASEHRARAAYQWSVDVSVYVDKRYRGQGVGKGLYRELFQILEGQGYHNVFAGITLPNAGSVALHESMGMKLVGVYSGVGFKLGAWHDVGWWQGSLLLRAGAPRTPLPFNTR